MSNEKFTPGPWAIQQVHQILWVGTPKRNGQLDELILHINQDVSYKDEKKERNLANAKLIAAAPEMYEALFQTFGGFIGILSVPHGSKLSVELNVDHVNKVLALLQKVTQ
jgi:hypothetical protein